MVVFTESSPGRLTFIVFQKQPYIITYTLIYAGLTDSAAVINVQTMQTGQSFGVLLSIFEMNSN